MDNRTGKVDSGGDRQDDDDDDEERAIPDERAARSVGDDDADGGDTDGSGARGSGSGGHHRDSIWIGMGIHLPASDDEDTVRKRRHHRKKQQPAPTTIVPSMPAEADVTAADDLSLLAPGQRVMFLLKDDDGDGTGCDESRPALFTEMGELTKIGVGNDQEWRETARWVKFEEDVEEGGNRWSKPHVATVSLHSLFELRSCLLNGTVIIDMDAEDLSQIIDIMLDKMIANNQLEPIYRDQMRQVLLRRHKHQYEQQARHTATNGGGSSGGFLSAVRSISDIGRSFSHGRNLDKSKFEEESAKPAPTAMLSLPKVGSLPKEIQREGSHSDATKTVAKSKNTSINPPPVTKNSSAASIAGTTSQYKGNLHFMKKLPLGAEASNVLIGEVDFLQHHITAFVRLKSAVLLGDLTEVPVPTRFLFVLLGPIGHSSQYREIGRAIATLMSDEIFHDVAYKARNRTDLLDGVDEFLDQVTVLPPGEWDPNIRIEPPSNIPSQEKRKQNELAKKQSSQVLGAGDDEAGKTGGADDGAGIVVVDETEEDAHASDPALQRTGRLFGGLIADFNRKRRWYVSDFTDAFNLQCIATVCFMYFALLAPIVTFGGLLEEATHQRMAAMENLASGAICGTIYSLFSGQPLTIIGSTGPVLVFETIIFDLCTSWNLDYLSFRFCIYLWTALILFIMVATDASALVSYITRFTEESFATLIAVIFVYEAILKLWKIKYQYNVITYNPVYFLDNYSSITMFQKSNNAECACLSASPTPFTDIASLNSTAQRNHWNIDPYVVFNDTSTFVGLDYDRLPLAQCEPLHGQLSGDGCYELHDRFLMSLVLMSGTFILAMIFKRMRNSCYFPTRVRQVLSDFAVMLAIIIMTCIDMAMGINTPKLNVPSSFRPTWEGRGWWIHPFNDNPWWTLPAAFLPALLACILIFMDQQITAVIVNRKENKFKKGYGYHLDLLVLTILIIIVGALGLPIFVAATVLAINHVNSLRVESESRAPGEVPHFIGCREQRVTAFVTFVLIGSSVKMTAILSHIPMPVLYGVFLYMGISALGGIQLFDRILLLLMPMKYQPDTIYIRHVPITTIHKFTAFQVACFAMLWIIKSVKKTSMTFPIMLVAMVAVRKFMEKFFTVHDLKYLDDKMPEFHLRKKEDMKKRKQKSGVDSDGGGSGGDAIATDLHPVKTAGHLHIPMASGNIMKIPLSSIKEKKESDHPFNMSHEVHRSGMWKHIASESQASLGRMVNGEKESSPRSTGSPPMAKPEEHDDTNEQITIKVIKPSPHSSNTNLNTETQPLLDLAKHPSRSDDGKKRDESAV